MATSSDAHEANRGASYAKVFARIFGPVLLLVGILGLILGDKLLLDVLNIDLVEDVIHVVSGILLIGIGWFSSEKVAKAALLGFGVVYLVVTVLGFAAPEFIEELNPHGYTIVDNLIHLTVGAGAIAASLMMRTRSDIAPR